jgi:hypothetical protein
MTTNLDCQFSSRVTRSPSREGEQPLDDFAMLSRTGELSGAVHAIRSEVESNGFRLLSLIPAWRVNSGTANRSNGGRCGLYFLIFPPRVVGRGRFKYAKRPLIAPYAGPCDGSRWSISATAITLDVFWSTATKVAD